MHTLLAFSAVACGIALVGCAAWRGELDPAHNRRVEDRIREISQTNLYDRSATPPKTIDDQLETITERRTTNTAPKKEDVIQLSLADLRVQTLENNLDLDVALLDPEIAQTRISEERAKFDLTFFGGVGYERKKLPRLDDNLVEFDSDDPALDGAVVKPSQIAQTKELLAMDLGVKVPLPTGANAKLMTYLEENNTVAPKRFEEYVGGTKFSISQPLLRNAGVPVNTASIRLARLSAQVIDAQTKLAAIRVLAGAEKAYWRVYGAYKMLEVHQQLYDTAYDNLKLVRRRVEEGLSPEIEIVRSEVGVASRLEALIIAETNLRLQQRELKRIVNMDGVVLNSDIEFNVTSEPQVVFFDLDPSELVKAALDNRMELLELELKLAADAVKIEFAENQTLPAFVVDFSYGILDRQGSFGSSWRDQWDFENYVVGVGVRGEIPLTNEARKSQLRRAVISRLQRLASRDQREMAIRQEVLDSVDVLNQNWQRILAARQNVIVSGVNYEAELRQFTEGLRTMFEVLQALTILGDAQIREVKAIVAYQVAQIDIAYATGTLLGYADFDPTPIPLSRSSS